MDNREKMKADVIQHQIDFYRLQGITVSEESMAETAEEIVADAFGE